MKKIIYVTMMLMMMTMTVSAKNNKKHIDNRPQVVVVKVADRPCRAYAQRPAPRRHHARPVPPRHHRPTVIVYNNTGSWRHRF